MRSDRDIKHLVGATTEDECEICDAGSQYKWRIEALERKMNWLFGLLITTAVSSFGTLMGVIVLLYTK